MATRRSDFHSHRLLALLFLLASLVVLGFAHEAGLI